MAAIEMNRTDLILDATSDGYWDWNIESGTLFFSAGLLSILGYQADEVTPSVSQWESWQHPDDVQLSRQALQAHFDNPEKPYLLECHLRTKAGHWIPCEIRGKVVECSPDRLPLRLVGTVQVISERHERERLEREPGIIARDLLNSLTQTAIIATDGQGIITAFNAGAERILGMTAAEAIGRTRLDEFFETEELQERSTLLSALVSDKLSGVALFQMLAIHPFVASGQWTLLHAQGTRFNAQLNLSRLNPSGVVAVIEPVDGKPAYLSGPDMNSAGLDRTSDAMAFASPLGILHYANPAFVNLLGFTPAGYTLSEMFDLITPGDLSSGFQRMQQLRDKPGKPIKSVNRVKNPGGAWRWLELVTTNLVDDPSVQNIIVTMRDITAAIDLTHTIVRNEERFRLASKYTHIGIWDWNIINGELYWSDEISQLFGYTDGRTETTYANFLAAVHPLDRPKLQRAVDDTLYNGMLYEVQHRIVRPDGTVRWMQERGDAERDASGRPVRMLGVVWDITELIEAQARLIDREEHFRALAENSSEGVLVTDPQRIIRFASQSVKRVFGIPPESMVGKSLRDWLHPVDQRKVNNTFDLLLNSPGISVKIEMRASASGTEVWRWFEGTVTNLITNPSVNGFVVNLRDITARREALQELAQSEQRFRNLAQWAPVGIFQNNPDGSQIWSNQAWSDITGLTREEGLGFGWTKSITVEVQDRIRAEIESLSPNLRTLEYPLERPDGTVIWVSASAAPQYSANGEIDGYLGTLVDISEVKRLVRLKDEFISTINHELRTPLTSIHGALGLVVGGVMGSLPHEIHDVLSIAAKNTARLMRMINDFLDIEKIESGTIGLDRMPLYLDSLVREAVVDSQGYATLYQIELTITSLVDRVLVSANHDRLVQVMANLLSNAIKFSPKGYPVEISSTTQQGWVRVSIADRGPGIPVEFRPRLFDRFAQADASDQRPREGTGLGLSISRSIIHLHGGVIGFEDRPGGGTSFYFELPVYSKAKE